MAEEIVLNITVAAYTADPRIQPDASIVVAKLAPGTMISEFLAEYCGWVVRQPGKEAELLTYGGLQPLPATVNVATGSATIRAGQVELDRGSPPRTEAD